MGVYCLQWICALIVCMRIPFTTISDMYVSLCIIKFIFNIDYIEGGAICGLKFESFSNLYLRLLNIRSVVMKLNIASLRENHNSKVLSNAFVI